MNPQGIIITVIAGVLLIIALKAWLQHEMAKKKHAPYKVALDIHGVLDSAPEFFSHLSQLLTIADCEVHIVTGAESTPELMQQLKDLGIAYTHFFSITDYHKSIGTEVTYSSPGNPVIDPALWDSTKAWYCANHNINMMLDDSSVYGKYFTTPYIQVSVKKFGIEK